MKNYGLIGCGMMGWEHIENVNLLNGARINSVHDPVDELAHIAAAKAGGAKVCPTITDMVTDVELDAVIIVSPNNLHMDHLEMIAAHRTLPILCEKPLYTSAEQRVRLDAFTKTYDAPVWVAMEYRYMPPIAALIDQSAAVTGGVKMLSIREHRFPFLSKIGNWNRFSENTGGTLVEKCCHFFDLMRLIIGAEPIRVSASAGQMLNHLNERYDGRTPDIWDAGYVIFDFDNGARSMLELCMFADGSLWNEEISAVGELGKVECRLPGPHRFWPTDIGGVPHPQLTLAPRSPKNPITTEMPIDETLLMAGDHHGSTFYQHERFLAVVCGTGEVEVTLSDGRRAVQMGLAAQEAATRHCVVSL
jgi:predicted dehydrogenase